MLKPSDVLNKLDTEEEAEFKRWEAHIDKALGRYDGGEKFVEVGASARVLYRLVAEYGRAGWGVRVHRGDQRDPGTSLVFSMRGS